MINAIETTTDVNAAADDNGEDNEGEKIAIVGGNSSSNADSQRQCGKFSKRQISRELFVVNSSNLCDKSDNDNSSSRGNCELNKGRTPTNAAAAAAGAGRSGNRRKIFLDSSFGETVESLASSTPTNNAASNFTAKHNRSIDEMSTPNSSFHFNNTTRSSFGGNSSRKSFDCSGGGGGGKNNNSISRRNTSSPLCLGDFINTSAASSSGKQGTAAAAAVAGECRELNLELIKS